MQLLPFHTLLQPHLANPTTINFVFLCRLSTKSYLYCLDIPLSPPGSAPLPPSPSTIHPDFIIDAHSFPDRVTTDPSPIFGGLKDEFPRPPVKSAVQVKMNVSAEPAQAIL